MLFLLVSHLCTWCVLNQYLILHLANTMEVGAIWTWTHRVYQLPFIWNWFDINLFWKWYKGICHKKGILLDQDIKWLFVVLNENAKGSNACTSVTQILNCEFSCALLYIWGNLSLICKIIKYFELWLESVRCGCVCLCLVVGWAF